MTLSLPPIKISGLTVTRRLDHVPTKGSLVQAFCNSLSKERRIEWPSRTGHGDPDDHTPYTAKKRLEWELIHQDWKSLWITQPLELPPQDLWKRCSYACGWHLEDRKLRRSSKMTRYYPSVPPKQQWGSNLPDFMCFNPDQPAILIESRPISVANDRSNPKQNDVSEHLFLPLSHWNEQIQEFRMVLFRTRQAPSESSNGRQ